MFLERQPSRHLHVCWIDFSQLLLEVRYCYALANYGNTLNTVQCHYNAVKFLQTPDKINLIARPLGRVMVYILWVQTRNYTLSQSLQRCIPYSVIFDPVIAALDFNNHVCLPNTAMIFGEIVWSDASIYHFQMNSVSVISFIWTLSYSTR